ncbi:hypothetical protein CTRI78_v001476 [Colletotrichum trifolii]|uniref:Methyltransferase type 12 n=1 Tax=Colletotrichum trifolii TaxID=5466 RepID=A0A4R8RP64_COLTR|nr:hypothetical protein CTRI78_v001476 [Colletotrichum trifolii]
MTVEERPDQFTNTSKADFKSIYNQPDPRSYFKTLAPLQYQIPQQALPFVESLLENMSLGTEKADSRDFAKPRKVLDVCCSYGINAALLRCDLTFDSLESHYASSSMLSVREQVASDCRLFGSQLRRPDVEVLGLDVSPEAINYAVKTGLLKDGFAENLEISEPSVHFRDALRDVELVICTGGVGYVGLETFSRIAAAVEDTSNLWMATFVLRVFSFDDVSSLLEEKYGLITEKVPGRLFRQRTFASREEQKAAIADVRARGLDSQGLEDNGWFYAECYVTRPKAATLQMDDVLKGLVRE